MALPIVLVAVAGAAAALGIKLGVDAHQGSSKANELNAKAQEVFIIAKEKLVKKRLLTRNRLRTLGEIKYAIWGQDFERFLDLFTRIRHFPQQLPAQTETYLALPFTSESLAQMQTLSKRINKDLTQGIEGLDRNSVIGMAVYGGTTMFDPISASGTNASPFPLNATLAWLGDDAFGIEDLGMTSVSILGGIVASSVLEVGGFKLSPKEEEHLARARSTTDEARLAEAEMNTAGSALTAIADRVENYTHAIRQLRNGLVQAIDDLENILFQFGEDFASFGPSQRETVSLALQFVQLMNQLLETPLLTSDGALTQQAAFVLTESFATRRRLEDAMQ